MAKPLIQKLDVVARGALIDEYLAMAYNVEQSLIAAGAVPGKDYTYLDLYKLAQPLVIELFRDDSRQMEYDLPVR
ncbi:hypothetical protein [Stutzerimonas nitrititolerans]|uniref:hypothetical protein n=1 Tax=Stutzerimonas nitrititolerans TaxID=2482751 RepID=UPI0028A0601D|nr:hypothetical protein [Stutzerimonas nitrititolerans]